MLIVSQDKDGIINFENVVAIRLMTNLEDNKRNMIEIDTINGERYSVSKYDTEERAKEVLQEIVKEYENVKAIFDCETGKIKNFINRPKIYKMPEK